MRAQYSPILVLFFALVCLSAPAQDGASQSQVAIKDVHVIPMDANHVLEHQTVVIEKGVIRAVGPVGDLAVPEGEFAAEE